MDINGLPNLGEWPHLALTGLAGVSVYLLKRSVDAMDRRQDKTEENLEELEDKHSDLSSDVQVLLERTKNL